MTPPRPPPALQGREARAIHCVGVGGMGLGPLAIYLSRLGHTVTGEDDSMTDAMRSHLERAHIAIAPLSEILNLKSKIPSLLVISTAIPPQHPAYLAATRLGIPIVRRGDLLAEIVRDKKLIAICGSHGKTTTTAMLITALRRANISAGYILGGLFADDALPPADIGTTDYVVAEIDESDGTIENFAPYITIATNLDWDHPDHYRTPAEIERAFHSLFARTTHAVLTRSTGILPVGLSSTGFQPVIPSSMGFQPMVLSGMGDSPMFPSPTGDTPVSPKSPTSPAPPARHTFGPDETATYRYTILPPNAASPHSTFFILHSPLGGSAAATTATVRALGDFNAANAAAALAAAHLMGATLTPDLLAAYPGVRRRQTILHATDTLTVLEDYAHHPAEIRALLSSLRARIPATGRLLVVFQPHRYTRTAQFKPDFAAALALADRAYLLDTYPAGEPCTAAGSASALYATLRSTAHLSATPTATPTGAVAPHSTLSILHSSLGGEAAATLPVAYHANNTPATLAALTRDLRPHDYVAFVGAGNIDRTAQDWLAHVNGAAAPLRVCEWPDTVNRKPETVNCDGEAVALRANEPLAPKTTMRTGGPARLYAEPATEPDLARLLAHARTHALPVLLLGRGSNLLVPDEGVDALVISLAHPDWQKFEVLSSGSGAVYSALSSPVSGVHAAPPLIHCGAGLRLKTLCGQAATAGLAGLEFLEGIPGTLGGALHMNAGAMGDEIFNHVETVRVMTRTGELRTLRPLEMGISYRHCAALAATGDAALIALSATLRPNPKSPIQNPKSIRALIEANRARRQLTQPREPSAGSIFKNPPNDTAGRLIDTAGLKGTRIGGAEVSPLHANFIINRANATTTDIIELIRHIRATVAEKHGVLLEPEVQLYGADWKDHL